MKVAVFGANGKMGRAVLETLKERGHAVCPIEKDTTDMDGDCQVAIDFSSPKATEKLVYLCQKHHVPLVCGTTGQSDEELSLLEKLGESVSVVKKANFSVGFDTLCTIVETACTTLIGWDKQLLEIHKIDKKDKPSGSAKVLAKSMDVDYNEILSLRLANHVGEHVAIFENDWESVTVTHKVFDRKCFAQGAVDLAEKIAKK